MFGKKNPPRISIETLPEDIVHLKTILGVKPGVYLSILYACVLFLILFFFLIFPGISKPGTVLSLSSDPAGAAVRVDDIYYGTTPCDIFVSRGEHRIQVLLPDFTPYEETRNVSSRLFGSLFVPKRISFMVNLETKNPDAVLSRGAAEYAAWSFTGESTSAYQIPQVLSETVYRARATDPETLNSLIKGSARYAGTKTTFRDMVRAKVLGDNAGNAPSPVSLLRSASDVLAYLSEYPESAAWLAGMLPREETNHAWFQKKADPPATPQLSGRQIVIEGIVFHEIGDFWIAHAEVNTDSWDLFLSAHPEWKVDDTGYWTDTIEIVGVSWYAARAYCEWLTGFLPPELNGYQIRLPSESEWEQSARADDSLPVLENMLGGLWEWCSDYFVPVHSLPDAFPIEGPERSIRGGSWVNTPATLSIDTRGSLPPDWSSPFVSFRPVIAPVSR
ncbi:hypothetical protein FACS1894172_12020 [Spirochaetia bacterium]|nr:hypothetical protein FACS1894164_01790 [Spirochaetia bacterium]GHU33459.1 hypothetical protein FACS1894172_12020 [Spirochaetia bacterium]